MTHRIGNTLYICPSPPAECSKCKMIEELRPYGPDGTSICMVCAHEIGLETCFKNYAELNAGVTSVEIDPDFKAALQADFEIYDALPPLERAEATAAFQKKWYGKPIGWLREQLKEGSDATRIEG